MDMVQIGGKPESDFHDPLGMLSDCHRRVENFLRVLRVVCEQAEGRALNDEQRRAFTTALRYFREAAPKHTADEEESLFPRMREVAGDTDEVRQALARVEALEADHRTAGPDHQVVDSLGEKWLRDSELQADEFKQLHAAVLRLVSLYQEHIKIEDEQVFPLARRILPQEVQETVGREMAGRRGVPST